jgi:hypothetical protein
MNKIKWTGPKHHPDFGICIPGQIVTTDQVSLEVMEKWVDQGMAEWIGDDQVKPVHTGPVKNTRKRKRKEE